MYTLEQLQQKTFKELKGIGQELNVLPAGDRRQKQTWIDALVGAKLPLLELLEVSPATEVESVEEPIEIQHQEVIEVQAQEAKFGRIVYPKPAVKPIAPATETPPGVESFTEASRPPNRGDNGRGRIESESELSQSAMAFRPASYGCDDSPAVAGITFSPRFLATYPPYFGEIRYKAEATGQLNFLEPETTEEPPDPDDFESIDAFWEAMARWDAEHPPEPLEVSMASMCEWAPCPDDWYEPAETNETIETVSCTLEISPVSVESSDTSDFSIPTFDAWCVACGAERHRPNGKDEPPTASVGARLPKPKPPNFPSAVVAKGDRRTNGKKFACSAILLSGRAPPGGDAM